MTSQLSVPCSNNGKGMSTVLVFDVFLATMKYFEGS